MTTPNPDIAAIAARLSERQRDFIDRVITLEPLRLADREEDRARQSVRRLGLVEVLLKPRRWSATPLGLAVRDHIMREGCDGRVSTDLSRDCRSRNAVSHPQHYRSGVAQMTLSQQIRALLPKVTKGPYDRHTGGKVRALRGDMAVPIWESRTPHGDHPKAPTVRDGNGEVVMRANSEGAKIRAALKAEHANVDLVWLLLNHATQIADALERDEARKDDGR